MLKPRMPKAHKVEVNGVDIVLMRDDKRFSGMKLCMTMGEAQILRDGVVVGEVLGIIPLGLQFMLKNGRTWRTDLNSLCDAVLKADEEYDTDGEIEAELSDSESPT